MKKIGFVGAGNMAGALLRGLLRAGCVAVVDRGRVLACQGEDVAHVCLRRLRNLQVRGTARE